MKSIIVIYSYHHNNTKKVAEAIGSVIGSEIKSVFEVEEQDILESNLIGFGSGIDSGKHYKELLEFAEKLSSVKDKNCYIFSTSAMQGKVKVEKDHLELRTILKAKGYSVIGEFSCKGFNTNNVLKFIGGMNKTRPNEEDIRNATDFALNINKIVI